MSNEEKIKQNKSIQKLKIIGIAQQGKTLENIKVNH